MVNLPFNTEESKNQTSPQIDNILKKIIENPYEIIYNPLSSQNLNIIKYQQEVNESLLSEEETKSLFIEEKTIISLFLKPIEIVMRPHITVSQEILNKLYQARKDPQIEKNIEQYGTDLIEKLENVRKFYRIFIESNTDEFLEKEASRLVKRFFGDHFKENHKNFIKLKRYVEKLKSFYELIIKLWKDIQNLIDAIGYIIEIQIFVENLKNKISQIQILNHQTQMFLKIIENYIKIQEYQYNSTNLSYTIVVSYFDDIDYTLNGLYNYFTKMISEDLSKMQQEEVLKKEVIHDVQSIVIESNLKRFYKFTEYTKMIGSKEWNRTKDYYLELNKQDYEHDLNKFYQAVHVIYNEETFEEALQVYSSKRTPMEKTKLEEIFLYYINMIQDVFNENYQMIIYEDFRGINHPAIFFYHIGVNTFYNIIKEDLRERKLGEILFLDNQVLVREYPYNIIKKILIDWWEDLTNLLDFEEVDSYWIYSLQLNIVLKKYLSDYEIIKNHTKQTVYFDLDKYFFDHYKELIGIRKFYIYKRFYPTLLFNYLKNV